MTRYLHTMLRITDSDKSRAFYEALGLEFRRESPIVRNGETEATLYFFGVPGQEEELELTLKCRPVSPRGTRRCSERPSRHRHERRLLLPVVVSEEPDNEPEGDGAYGEHSADRSHPAPMLPTTGLGDDPAVDVGRPPRR